MTTLLRELQRLVEAAPPADCVHYLVLDHAVTPGRMVPDRDGSGRKFMRLSPSVMDAAVHVKGGEARWHLGLPVYLAGDAPE